jgi:hypothetical protein
LEKEKSAGYVKLSPDRRWLTFTRTLHFPIDDEGWGDVNAAFVSNDPPLQGTKSIALLILEGKGMVIGPGTPIPAYTPEDKSNFYNWSEMTPTPIPVDTLPPEVAKRAPTSTATPPIAYPDPASSAKEAVTPYP